MFLSVKWGSYNHRNWSIELWAINEFLHGKTWPGRLARRTHLWSASCHYPHTWPDGVTSQSCVNIFPPQGIFEQPVPNHTHLPRPAPSLSLKVPSQKRKTVLPWIDLANLVISKVLHPPGPTISHRGLIQQLADYSRLQPTSSVHEILTQVVPKWKI